jgi:MFS family permease
MWRRQQSWMGSNRLHSSLVCATAPNSTALIVGRAIAGLGTGGLFSGAIVILAYCCKYLHLSLLAHIPHIVDHI